MRQEGSRGGSAARGLEGWSGQISQNLLEPGPWAQALMSGCEGNPSYAPQDKMKARGRRGERCSQDSQDTMIGTTG